MKRITLLDFNKSRTRKTTRWLGWLSFCMMIFMGQIGFAQTVQIGSGTTTTTAGSTTVPVTNYHYSYCQMIITEAQITAGGGGVGEIQKLRFYNASIGTTSSWADDWTIYLGNTAKTSFSSDTDWVALADLQEVYTGAVSPVANDWWEIIFTIPFNYTGGNLIVAVDENTPGWLGTPTFFTFSSGTDTAILYRTDNVADNPDPANPPLVGTGGLLALTNILPQMQFYFTEDCPSPTQLIATNFTSGSVDLGWVESTTATSWDIEWGIAGFTPTGTPSLTGVTNPYTLSGLNPYTGYEFYVRSDCGATDGVSTWAGPFSFKTLYDCSAYIGDITSVTGGYVCDEGTTTLQATATGVGSAIYWYDAEFGGNLVGEGTSFETPFLTETTSFWASEVELGTQIFTEQGNLSPTTLSSTTAGGITFVLNQTASIISFEARSTTAAGGAVTYALIDVDNGNSVLMTHDDNLPGGGTGANPVLYTVNLNFNNISPGTYRLIKQSGAASAYMTGAFPYPLGVSGQVINGAGSATSTSTLYYHFFNITIEEAELLCESDREEVIATLQEIIDIEAIATSTSISPGGSTTLTATSTNSNYAYAWSWDGGTDTGASITVSPLAHTTYTVTATDTITGCQTIEEIEILVFNMVDCDDLEITNVIDGNICNEGSVVLSANAAGITGDTIYWYDAAVDGNLLGQGTSFETPFLTQTTSFWAAEALIENIPLTGQAFASPSTFTNYTTNAGVRFEVTKPINIVDVQIFKTNATAGDVIFELRDVNDGNQVIATTTVYIDASGTAAAPTPVTIPLGFYVPEGSYSLVRVSATPTGVGMGGVTSANSNFPYPLGGSGQVTGGATLTSTSGIQYYFFNWTIEELLLLCESDREEVVATVHEIIGVDITATDTSIIPGNSTVLTASSTNTNYTYAWSWDGGTDTGTSITVSPAVHTTYTVTAIDSVTGCQTTSEIEILVFDTTLCNTLDVIGSTSGAVCHEGIVMLQATGSGTGSEIYWYDAEVDGNLVGQGTSFETPLLTETTSYWASEALIESTPLSGQAFANPTTFTNSTSNAAGLLFEVTKPIKIVDVQVFGTNSTGGEVTIELRDVNDGNNTIATAIATIAGGGTAANPTSYTIPLNFDVPVGNYRLVRTAATPSGVGLGYVSSANSNFPYPLGESGQVTGGATLTSTSTLQYFFFNWTIEEQLFLCESDREEVVATVNEITDVNLSATTTSVSPGDSTTLTASSSNTDYAYVWSWDGGTDTGTSITVSPTAHTVYTLTTTDTVTGCQADFQIEILVFDTTLCNTLDIVSNIGGTVCEEGIATLQAIASGTGSVVYWYDAAVGGNKVGEGTSFETPLLTETTSYWATEVLQEMGGGSNALSTYCIPTFNTGCTSSDTIDDFILKDSSDTTLISHLGTGCSPSGYGDFTADTSLTAELEAGETYSFTATHGTSLQYVRIWIDFDGNGSFEDVGELVYVSTTAGNASTPTQGSFDIPASAIGINTVMRVKTTYSTGVSDSCTQTGSWGEAHDYKINIIGVKDLCESDRVEVIATVIENVAPIGDAVQVITEGSTLADLDVTATGTLTWYSDADLTTEVAETLVFDQLGTFTYYVTQTISDCESDALAITVTVEEATVACDISVTISSSGWGDVVTWNLLDGDGVAVLSGGNYGSNYSDNQIYIAINPPYTLQIIHDENEWICDNDVNYLVTIGGVTELSGTINDPCYGGTTNLSLTSDLTACIPDCPAPGNLLAGNFTFTSAELSWTGDASLFDIEWGLEGFTQGSGTEVNNISANTHPLTGLTAETSYDFYVRQNCGIDGLSTWAGPYTFYTGYCEVSTTNTTDYISEFSTSGATQNVTYTATSQPAGSYANETAQIIQQAQGLPINFTSTFVGGGNAIKIWVDVNNDLIFDEATEVVFYEASTAATKNGTVTVPVELPIGEYRVRVRGQYGSSANPLACGNVAYGSTIDFTLQVTAAPSCLPVSDLSATTTSNSATLSWISTGTLFDIEYGATGFTQGTGTPINEVTNPYTLNGLNIGSYDYYVRQNCGNGDESIWIGPYNFTVGAYQAGDIPTQSGTSAGITVNSTDYCTPEPTLTIDVPAGMQIASLQVQYSMTAHNGAWMSEQRSFIYSPTLNTGEATMTSGTGTAGTLEYNRSVDFANGATGSVDFVLRAWRTWSTFGEEGCSTYNNYVNNGTWVITPTFEPFVDPCDDITAPIGNATQTLDLGDTLADLVISGETGAVFTWYADAGFANEVPATTVAVDGATYWVTQTVGTCTSDALAITVTVIEDVDPCDDITAPTGDAAQTLDLGDTLADLVITGETGAVFTWYADADLTNGVPATTEAVDGATYWVTQTVGTCTSDALAITVTVIDDVDPCDDITVPTGNATQTLDLGDTLADLVISGETGAVFTWYADAGLANEVPANTEAVDGATYWVTQTVGGCTSEALAITVTVIDPCGDVLAPVAESPQSMTVGQTVGNIIVDGANLTWYSDSDLTNIVEESFELSEGIHTFWVTQTVDDCTSAATEIEVEVTLSTDRFDEASFSAYPNPVRDFFNISYSSDISDVMVINMLGQTIVSKVVNATDTQIDMSELPTGTYFVKVNIDGIIKTIKVAKQ